MCPADELGVSSVPVELALCAVGAARGCVSACAGPVPRARALCVPVGGRVSFSGTMAPTGERAGGGVPPQRAALQRPAS